MTMTRREFIKRSAAAATAAAAGIPAGQAQLITDATRTHLDWAKAPCRFCGVGCGVNVAVKDGRVVATHGDINAEVNRGLNCVKGYFLSKILYGADRLAKPLLRKKNGVFHPLKLLISGVGRAQAHLPITHSAIQTVGQGPPYGAIAFRRPATRRPPRRRDAGPRPTQEAPAGAVPG